VVEGQCVAAEGGCPKREQSGHPSSSTSEEPFAGTWDSADAVAAHVVVLVLTALPAMAAARVNHFLV
jgi:hypothetical protein